MRSFPIQTALLTLLAVALVALAGCNPSTTAPSSGTNPVDEVGLIDLDDQRVDVWESGDAKATVFLFTRTDCPISNRYAPEIRRLYDEYHPQSVDFYLVYVDPTKKPEEIRQHLKEYSYPCPAVRDLQHAFDEQVGVKRTPEAAVYDADRKLVYRGRISDWYVDFGKARAAPTTHDLADALHSVLDGKKITEPFTEAVWCYISDLKK